MRVDEQPAAGDRIDDLIRSLDPLDGSAPASPEVSRYFQPLGLERFLSEVWGQSHLHLRGADGQHAHLLPWDELNRILQEHRLDFPRVRLVKAGRPLPPSEYRAYQRNKRGEVLSHMVPARVDEALADGATLVVDSVDEMYPPLRHLADLFTDAFRTTVRVNAYLSAGREAGFLPHWDDHEVIVLQIHGHKRWKVFGVGTPWPIRQGVDGDPAPPDQVLWEGLLRAGDLLYLPRGCWHVALAESAPTLHLSIGIHNKTGLDFIEWLHGHLRASETFRRDLPAHAGHAAQTAHAEKLLAELSTWWRPEMVHAFLAETRAATAVRRTFNLPRPSSSADADPGPDARVRLRVPAADALATAADGEVTLVGDGRRWVFDARARPLLQRLSDEYDVSMADLCAIGHGIDDASLARAFVRALVREGLASVREAGATAREDDR